MGYDSVGTDNNQPKAHKTGWGVDPRISFKVSLATFRLGAVYGRGIASYMNDGGMDSRRTSRSSPAAASIGFILVPSAEAVKLFGMTSYVDLNWSKQRTSSLGYSFDKVDNTNFQTQQPFTRGSMLL